MEAQQWQDPAKPCPLPDLNNSTAMPMYFCPHLENLTPPILLPLPCVQSPSPPSSCWIALLSHAHPYFLISHFHTNLPDKLSPLSSIVCLRLALILQKTSFFQSSTSHPLHMWGGAGKDITPGQKWASCQGGQVPGPTTGRGSGPNHLQSLPKVPSALWKLCLLKKHPYLPLFSLSTPFLAFHTLC